MKHLSCSIAVTVLLLWAIPSQSQPLNGHWSYTEIAMDSLEPGWLFFMDSSHGLFCGKRWHQGYWNIFNQFIVPLKLHWFRTSDGGVSWLPIDFTGLEYADTTTEGQAFTSYFFHEISPTKGNIVYLPSYGIKSDPNSWRDESGKTHLLLSKNYGEHWESMGFLDDTSNVTSMYHLMGSPGYNFLYKYGSDSGNLYFSNNYGKTFPYLRSDSVFRSVALLISVPIKTYINNLGFSYSDAQHFTYVDNTRADFHDSSSAGLLTLVTGNGGDTWERFNYVLPGYEDKTVHGILQYITGTSYLYFFPCLVRAEGQPNEVIDIGSGTKVLYQGSDSYLNLSYLYSSDYGRSWRPDHTFGMRRRGFEAVAQDEVWMTVTPDKDFNDFGRKASWIVRTKDNGLSWDIDSTTLGNFFERTLDGRIIAADAPYVWIAAYDGRKTYIFRYTPPPLSVEAGDPQLQAFRIKIYPNPADKYSTILVDKSESIRSVEVYDPFGRPVPMPVTIGKSSAEVRTEDFPSGCYLLRVIFTRGQRYVRPLIVGR